MPERRHTKIVATLGPASNDYDTIEALFRAGVDVFRLNFSHGAADDHRRTAGSIRKLESVLGQSTCILGDLQGPKLRIGPMANDAASIEEGATFIFDQKDAPGSPGRVQLPHPEIFAAVADGDILLLDDGKLRLEVSKHDAERIETRVLVGGTLRGRKGVSLPGTLLDIPALTAKDREDLETALDIGVDWIAQSFVQRAEDVEELKSLVDGRADVVVKLEKPQALGNLEAIVATTDAVMVARGDLGVELSAEEVPPAQKEIIDVCRAHGKPTIVATQMLESMIDSPTPTRAEASDVANAVYDGADAVMLSAETAIGAYPLEAVAVMDRIVRRIERDPRCRRSWHEFTATGEDAGTAAIVACIGLAAERAQAATIASYTTSGATARRVANVRPEAPILAMTPSVETWRKLRLVWGVHAVKTEDATSVQHMVENAVRCASELNFSKEGDHIVISAGMPFGTPGRTNLLRIAEIDHEATSFAIGTRNSPLGHFQKTANLLDPVRSRTWSRPQLSD